MASIAEIKGRMRSVEQTLKITSAMYLISSSKLKKARRQLADVEPFFEKITSTIVDIIRHSPEIDHLYFDKREDVKVKKRGYVVITGDKGMAGAYNHNILKLAESQITAEESPTLFVIGQMGRHYFTHKKITIDAEFMYTAQDPNMHRAREIGDTLISLFLERHLDEVYLIYTKMVTPMRLEPKILKLLPLDKEAVRSAHPPKEERYRETISYVPSMDAVLDKLVPGYVKGVVFGALVESFSSEQSARMTAMDSSTQNAKEMIKTLSLQYNRARQAAITQEITEIVGGAQGLSEQ